MGTATDYDISSLSSRLGYLEDRLRSETQDRREEQGRLRDKHLELHKEVLDLGVRITARTCIGLIIVEILVIMILASRS